MALEEIPNQSSQEALAGKALFRRLSLKQQEDEGLAASIAGFIACGAHREHVNLGLELLLVLSWDKISLLRGRISPWGFFGRPFLSFLSSHRLVVGRGVTPT